MSGPPIKISGTNEYYSDARPSKPATNYARALATGLSNQESFGSINTPSPKALIPPITAPTPSFDVYIPPTSVMEPLPVGSNLWQPVSTPKLTTALTPKASVLPELAPIPTTTATLPPELDALPGRSVPLGLTSVPIHEVYMPPNLSRPAMTEVLRNTNIPKCPRAMIPIVKLPPGQRSLPKDNKHSPELAARQTTLTEPDTTSKTVNDENAKNVTSPKTDVSSMPLTATHPQQRTPNAWTAEPSTNLLKSMAPQIKSTTADKATDPINPWTQPEIKHFQFINRPFSHAIPSQFQLKPGTIDLLFELNASIIQETAALEQTVKGLAYISRNHNVCFLPSLRFDTPDLKRNMEKAQLWLFNLNTRLDAAINDLSVGGSNWKRDDKILKQDVEKVFKTLCIYRNQMNEHRAWLQKFATDHEWDTVEILKALRLNSSVNESAVVGLASWSPPFTTWY